MTRLSPVELFEKGWSVHPQWVTAIWSPTGQPANLQWSHDWLVTQFSWLIHNLSFIMKLGNPQLRNTELQIHDFYTPLSCV